MVISEGDDIVAVGIAAPHPQPDGSEHWAVETVVRPDLAFVDFEETVLDRALSAVPDEPLSVWSSRSSLDAALDRLGFSEVRRLLHLCVDLPLAPAAEPEGIRSFRDDDLDAVLAVNRAAFAEHREAAVLDHTEFRVLAGQPWFDPEGLLIADPGTGIAGFCWTKVHPNGDGEIYRIAVDPSRQGAGWGRRLVTAGFAHLAAEPTVERGSLWVDAANDPAITLYESLGMVVTTTNAEFERQPKR